MIRNLDLKENLILCHTIGLKGTNKGTALDAFNGWKNVFEKQFEEYANIINIFNTSFDFYGVKSEVLWPNIPATEERINEILEEIKKVNSEESK